MAPKKKNGFYYFMLDFQKREAEKGVKISLPTASKLAGPLWEKLTYEEKKVFNDMAQANSQSGSDDLTKKFTSLGVSYATLDLVETERREFLDNMSRTIKQTIANLQIETTLKTHKFFVCHVNYYYKTEDNYRAPAEFALATFNLEQGLIDSIHFFFEVGIIPLGLKYSANEWCTRTHNIPLNDPSWTGRFTNYKDMFEKVQDFLNKHSDSSERPPIYTMTDSLTTNYSHTAVQCAFENMCGATHTDHDFHRIYYLENLFFELRNKCSFNGYLSSALMKAELEKDVFSYAKDLGCFFHEEKDLSIYCSLSIVVRWIFTICDHCCKHINIPLRLGYHIPMEANINWKQENLHGKYEHPYNETSRNPISITHHERLKEKRFEEKLQQDALYQQSESLRLPKQSYSTKIGAKFTVYEASSLESQESPAEDDCEWTTVPTRSGAGHGRGKSLPRKEDIVPISGRGRLAAMNYKN